MTKENTPKKNTPKNLRIESQRELLTIMLNTGNQITTPKMALHLTIEAAMFSGISPKTFDAAFRKSDVAAEIRARRQPQNNTKKD